MGEEYVPSSLTSAYRLSRFSRGTRTWSNHNRPLSTPFSPILAPSSSMRTPLSGLPLSSRMGTTNPCTPSEFPLISSWAKTTAMLAWSAALPM